MLSLIISTHGWLTSRYCPKWDKDHEKKSLMVHKPLLIHYLQRVPYQVREIAVCASGGNAGNVSHRLKKLAISACITARAWPLSESSPWASCQIAATQVPWWMLGSPTRGAGENDPDIPGACSTHPQFYVSGKRPIALTESSLTNFKLDPKEETLVTRFTQTRSHISSIQRQYITNWHTQ